jgi:4-diphosphocytidyl-2-C-methyl-D-erythritol kinase
LLKSSFNSYAKINLGLAITGKRSDNYHLLSSLFIPITLHDTISIELDYAKELEVKIKAKSFYSKSIPLDDTNIIYKAAKLVSELSNVKFKLNVDIEKNIPVKSGLGGGSSNAAFLIKELNKLLKLDYSLEYLQKISLSLGADIPFFIKAKPSLVEGIGEKISVFDIKESFELLIIKPSVDISTAMLYSSFILDLTLRNSNVNNFSQIKKSFSKKLADLDIMAKLSNDLEKTAIKKSNEIEQAKTFINKYSPIVCMMSGSGSSVYGVFKKAPDLGLKKFKGFKAGFIDDWFFCNTKFLRRT